MSAEAMNGIGDLAGKAEVLLRASLKRLRRDLLEGLVVRLLTVEPTLTPAQIATLRNKDRRTIVRLIQRKELPATRWTGKDYEVPISAVRDRDRKTATMPLPSSEQNGEIDRILTVLRRVAPK